MNNRTVNLAHHLLPVGSHQALTPTASAANVSDLTGYSVPAGSVYVHVQCVGGAARTTADGATAPTASLGHLWSDGAERWMRVEEWAKTKVILGTSTPVLQVQHYQF